MKKCNFKKVYCDDPTPFGTLHSIDLSKTFDNIEFELYKLDLDLVEQEDNNYVITDNHRRELFYIYADGNNIDITYEFNSIRWQEIYSLNLNLMFNYIFNEVGFGRRKVRNRFKLKSSYTRTLFSIAKRCNKLGLDPLKDDLSVLFDKSNNSKILAELTDVISNKHDFAHNCILLRLKCMSDAGIIRFIAYRDSSKSPVDRILNTLHSIGFRCGTSLRCMNQLLIWLDKPMLHHKDVDWSYCTDIAPNKPYYHKSVKVETSLDSTIINLSKYLPKMEVFSFKGILELGKFNHIYYRPKDHTFIFYKSGNNLDFSDDLEVALDKAKIDYVVTTVEPTLNFKYDSLIKII